MFLGNIYADYDLPEKIIVRCQMLSRIQHIVNEYNEKLKNAGCTKRFFVSMGTASDVLCCKRNVKKSEKKDEELKFLPVIYLGNIGIEEGMSYLCCINVDKNEFYEAAKQKLSDKLIEFTENDLNVKSQVA